ncbi:MAG: hypothetical protein ACJ8FY_26710 [Gemmataceae bacterium]
MRIPSKSILLAGLVFLATSFPVRACGYGVPNPFARFTQAESVVVGKVTGFDGRMVSAALTAGAPAKQEFAVAEVEIMQALKGAVGLTHLRIGFLPAENLQVGQVGCFFLNPHFAEPFYLMPRGFGLPTWRDNNPGFDAEVKQYECWGNLLRDPNTALQSENPEDRYLTAALLLAEYRTFQTGVHDKSRKMTPIDAELSKRILLALADADWTNAGQGMPVLPAQLFAQLGVTRKEGWNTPESHTGANYEAAAKKWLKDNAETFRIKAYVRV